MAVGASDPQQFRYSFCSKAITTMLTAVLNHIRGEVSRGLRMNDLIEQTNLLDRDYLRAIMSVEDLQKPRLEAGVSEAASDLPTASAIDSFYTKYRYLLSRLDLVMRGRRTFMTCDGRLGLGGQSVQPGDLVCLIADGAHTPFLLRMVNDDKESLRLISEAFVEGIMYGEALGAGQNRDEIWKEVCIVRLGRARDLFVGSIWCFRH